MLRKTLSNEKVSGKRLVKLTPDKLGSLEPEGGRGHRQWHTRTLLFFPTHLLACRKYEMNEFLDSGLGYYLLFLYLFCFFLTELGFARIILSKIGKPANCWFSFFPKKNWEFYIDNLPFACF